MKKALRAIASAELLHEAGDVDGATNRAYYAMFDAAKAALIWANATTEHDVIKTHSGLITIFSRRLIKSGRLPIDMGKSLTASLKSGW